MGGGPDPRADVPKLDPWDVKPVKLAPKPTEQAHSHGHSLRAFEWPAWFVEKIAPKDADSAGVKVVKIGAVILSPPVVALLALWGHAVDELGHIYDGIIHFIGPNIPLTELPNLIGRAPGLSLPASEEGTGIRSADVAYDTVPPAPERPRERNKCGAAARGGRR